MDTDELMIPRWRADAGQRILTQLTSDRFEIRAALWMKRADEAFWSFCIVTPLVETAGLAQAYRHLQEPFRHLTGISVSLSEVWLVGAYSSVAKDVARILERSAGHSPIFSEGRALGETALEMAYIDPAHLYEQSTKLKMSRQDVLRELLRLMGRGPGVWEPSAVLLGDGTTFAGVPFALQLGSKQNLVAHFVASEEVAPRIYDVDEIALIE